MSDQSPFNVATRRRMAGLESKVRACGARIAKERDKLRDLVDEYQEISDHCDEAIDDIDRAADSLSRFL